MIVRPRRLPYIFRPSLLEPQVARDSAEWNELKESFLKKNPFEEPFFGYDTLRMVRVTPKRVSYANGLEDMFKAEL